MLRKLDPGRDGEALHAIFGDAASCTYMTGPAMETVEETVSLLKKWTEGTEDTSWAIVARPDGEALGRVTLIPRAEQVFEIGIMLCPAARGSGLATKALEETLDHAFDTLNARRVYADIDPDNEPSIKLFERLGFVHEGVLRATWKTHIGVRDTVLMSLIASDPKPWRG